MSYPQQGPYPPAYPPPAQPGYPPQQGYPPPGQYPPPQGYAPPPPQYAPPPQQYAPPQPEPLARGTIDDFYDQPAASGKSLSFDSKPPGTAYAGVVARSITHADIQVATDKVTRQPRRHPDGRLKYNMIIPLILAPSAEHPDGRASWYVKAGAEREELSRAMEDAGLPPGTPPEQGALITITYTGDRPIPGLNPQKVKRVTYQRPQGATQPAADHHQPASVGQPNGQGNGQPPPQDQPPWQQAPPQAPVQQPYLNPAGQAPVEYATAPPQAPVQQQAPQPPPMQAPPGLTPEQLAALAAITGQQQ